MGTPSGNVQSPGPVHATLYRIDPSLIDPSVQLPVVEPNTYELLDDDAKQCSIIGDDELNAAYVDKHIASYRLDGIETWPQVPNPDNHNVIITYGSGSQATISIGSIGLDPGPAPDQYYKTGGIIYPIDQSGGSLFNATNTPNLAYIRNQYWDMARKQTETNVMFAEIVATFADAVAALGHAGEATNYITSPDNTNEPIPTPGDSPEDHTDGQGSGSSSN
ncbi:MAG: hypothetical protein ACRD3S_11340 [Terracidiphilus sp.]